jgi:hypothetical protein
LFFSIWSGYHWVRRHHTVGEDRGSLRSCGGGGGGKGEEGEALPKFCHDRSLQEFSATAGKIAGKKVRSVRRPALPALTPRHCRPHRHCRPRRIFDSFLCRGRIYASFSAATGIFCRESVFGCFLLLLLLLLLVRRGGQILFFKEEDIGVSEGCILRCFQLIWI